MTEPPYANYNIHTDTHPRAHDQANIFGCIDRRRRFTSGALDKFAIPFLYITISFEPLVGLENRLRLKI